MISVRLVGAVVVAACAMTALLVTTQSGGVEGVLGADETKRDSVIAQRFAGHGGWTGASGNEAVRPWHVHAIKRADGALAAKVSVPGAGELQSLTAEGHIDGRDAFGVLLTDDGEQYATFEATLDEDGTGGTFVLGNGESGTWGYDAATGREVRRLMGVVEAEVAADAESAAASGS